jgi:hypothetical protein
LTRSTPTGASAGSTKSDPTDPFRRDLAPTKQDDDFRRMTDPQHRSIQELEAELNLAMANAAQAEQLAKQAAISTSERDQARGKVLIIKAKLEGRYDELSDEIERLQLAIKTKRAEREKNIAYTEVESSVVARNTRLNERKPGMVSPGDVAKAEWQMKAASAQVDIVEAEIAETELRVKQLERRRTRITQIIKLANA